MRAGIKVRFYTGARTNSQGLKLSLNYFNFLLSLFTVQGTPRIPACSGGQARMAMKALV